MNDGTCSIQENLATCTCTSEWTGEICEIAQEKVPLIVLVTETEIAKELAKNKTVEAPLIDNINTLKGIVSKDPSLITNQLTNEVTDLAENKIGLITQNKTDPDP